MRCIARPNSSSASIFAVTLSSLASSCVLFDVTSRQLVDLKWLMLNKQKMIPFIACEISLCQYVCELGFLVSMYLIWIFGSKLIRSSNQSRATLLLLETSLIVGLLPFRVILITASSSSNTYNKGS